jgi:hypothetical protein
MAGDVDTQYRVFAAAISSSTHYCAAEGIPGGVWDVYFLERINERHCVARWTSSKRTSESGGDDLSRS